MIPATSAASVARTARRCAGLWAACAAALLTLAGGCGVRSTELVGQELAQRPGDGGRDGGGATRDGGDGGEPQADAASTTRPPMLCDGAPCACDNGLDDDGDGLIDGFDPECTSIRDNDESSFSTGTAATEEACRDCFWDANLDHDDDGCSYATECLNGDALSSETEAACGSCTPTLGCINSCERLAPSGCDCFGCCDVTLRNGERVQVVLRDDCAVQHADDPTRCPPCKLRESCMNPCGDCELCLGRKRKDLPRECRGSPTDEEPQNQCEGGEIVCNANTDCPSDFWCQLGCCTLIPQ